MNKLLMFLLGNLKSFGELKNVCMYDDTFTTLKFESEDSEYEITMRRKDKVEEGEENGN